MIVDFLLLCLVISLNNELLLSFLEILIPSFIPLLIPRNRSSLAIPV